MVPWVELWATVHGAGGPGATQRPSTRTAAARVRPHTAAGGAAAPSPCAPTGCSEGNRAGSNSSSLPRCRRATRQQSVAFVRQWGNAPRVSVIDPGVWVVAPEAMDRGPVPLHAAPGVSTVVRRVLVLVGKGGARGVKVERGRVRNSCGPGYNPPRRQRREGGSGRRMQQPLELESACRRPCRSTAWCGSSRRRRR